MPEVGFEPTTARSSAECSPRLSYSGAINLVIKIGLLVETKAVKRDFAISHIADLVATANGHNMEQVMLSLSDDSEPIMLKLLARMLYSKYVTNAHRKTVLGLLKNNLTAK